MTYNGHPVYLFSKDTKAGQTAGQGVSAFGAFWYVLSSTGNPITTQPASAGSGASSGVAGY